MSVYLSSVWVGGKVGNIYLSQCTQVQHVCLNKQIRSSGFRTTYLRIAYVSSGYLQGRTPGHWDDVTCLSTRYILLHRSTQILANGETHRAFLLLLLCTVPVRLLLLGALSTINLPAGFVYCDTWFTVSDTVQPLQVGYLLLTTLVCSWRR